MYYIKNYAITKLSAHGVNARSVGTLNKSQNGRWYIDANINRQMIPCPLLHSILASVLFVVVIWLNQVIYYKARLKSWEETELEIYLWSWPLVLHRSVWHHLHRWPAVLTAKRVIPRRRVILFTLYLAFPRAASVEYWRVSFTDPISASRCLFCASAK